MLLSREREKDRERERSRGNDGKDSRRHHDSDWDHETPRTDRRYGGAGETPYSKIRGRNLEAA